MINIQKVIFQTAKFNAVNIVSALIQIPTQFVVGVFLLPKEYGVVSLVGLWSLYSGLINPGMLSAGQREIPYLIGKNNIEKSLKVQNIAISSDFLYSFLPFLVIFCSAYFYSDKTIKIGLIITSFYFIINRIPTYWSSINFVRQNFSIVAWGKLIGVVSAPVTIICLISSFGIYAVLIAPLVGSILTGLFYFIKGPIGFSFHFEWKEVFRLIKVGFALTLIGIIFYGYKMADSTIIVSLLSLSDFGLFSFAMGLILFGISFLSDFGRVLEPIIWENTGKANVADNSFYNTKDIVVYIALITAVIIPFCQVCYSVLVQLFVPKYNESILIFIILSSMFYLATMAIIPNVILNSVVVNKQNIVVIVYLFGLIVNIIIDLFAIKIGYGVNAIALITIGSQFMITSILFVLVFKYILNRNYSKLKYLFILIFPFVISNMFSCFHYYYNNIFFHSLFGICLSLSLQIIIWILIISVCYKEYFSKKEIINFAKEIKRNIY